MVKDRIDYFNETYPEGSIETDLLSDPESDTVVVQAIVKVPFYSPQGELLRTQEGHPLTRRFTGLAQEKVGEGMINKTSALENAETSAVGRALAMMGIGVVDSPARS